MNVRPLIALACLAIAGPSGAAPTISLFTATSAARAIDTASADSAASTLAGSRVTAFFSDGSQVASGFVIDTVAGAVGTELRALALTDAFILTANTTPNPADLPLFSIVNTDDTRTLTGFRIDGAGSGAGQAAFDLTFGSGLGQPGTPGTEGGHTLDLRFSNPQSGLALVSYLEPLALAGAAPVGDLFGSVQVDFDFNTIDGLPPPTQFSGVFSRLDFRADIDRVTYAAVGPRDDPSDPGTGTGTVPEPASAALAGLALLTAWRARRRNAARKPRTDAMAR